MSTCPSRIEDYALIGDCETAALVSRDGSIDWLCWPRFDSAACFAALIGTEEHGRWLLAPVDGRARVSRACRTNTLVLETRFDTGEGVVTVVWHVDPGAPVRIDAGWEGYPIGTASVSIRGIPDKELILRLR